MSGSGYCTSGRSELESCFGSPTKTLLILVGVISPGGQLQADPIACPNLSKVVGVGQPSEPPSIDTGRSASSLTLSTEVHEFVPGFHRTFEADLPVLAYVCQLSETRNEFMIRCTKVLENKAARVGGLPAPGRPGRGDPQQRDRVLPSLKPSILYI